MISNLSHRHLRVNQVLASSLPHLTEVTVHSMHTIFHARQMDRLSANDATLNAPECPSGICSLLGMMKHVEINLSPTLPPQNHCMLGIHFKSEG